MMLNDYECPRHGTFEASHAICPCMGCDSEGVKKVFLKAPKVKSDSTKRFDAGMRQSAEMYNQSDWKTAREGESAKANNRAAELLWGDDAVNKLGNAVAVQGPSGTSTPTAPTESWAPSLVQGGNPLARAERTMGSKAKDDSDRAKLVQVAKDARTN